MSKRKNKFSSYSSSTLRRREQMIYRAAGILPIMFTEDEGWIVMVGLEKRHGLTCLNMLGGKRETSDRDPEHTASREFMEECGRLIPIEKLYFILRTNPKRFVQWNHRGKYCAYVLWVPKELVARMEALPMLYAEMEGNRPDHSEMDVLVWLPVFKLLEIPFNNPTIDINAQTVPVCKLLRDVLYTKGVRRLLTTVEAEETHIDSIK